MFEPVSEFREPLLLCYRSLHATGNGIIADGRLTDDEYLWEPLAGAWSIRPHHLAEVALLRDLYAHRPLRGSD